MTKTLIIIPARMAASRLPGKPLADIGGKPMICRVVEQAMASKLGEVFVATDSDEIAGAIVNTGAGVAITAADHPSGSDRIWEGLQSVDPKSEAEIIVNLQGDLPTISPALIEKTIAPLNNKSVDIATLAAEIRDDSELSDPNVVKVIGTPINDEQLRALYFTRAAAPFGSGRKFHHIGIYAYRRKALERFIALPPSPLEVSEKLEQLRALENGMTIGVQLVKDVPLGVDTQEDLEVVRSYFK